MSTLRIHGDGEFNENVLRASGPVLIGFEAEWCGPCRQMVPVIDEIAREKAGRLTVATVNIDRFPGILQKYGVRGIPTFIIFIDGEAVSTKLGSMPKDELVKWIDSITASQGLG
jgi:thioredoxin 1